MEEVAIAMVPGKATLKTLQDNSWEVLESALKNAPEGVVLTFRKEVENRQGKIFGVQYGGYLVSFNEFGNLRVTDGESLREIVIASTKSSKSTDAVSYPQSLTIVKKDAMPGKILLSAYSTYAEEKKGFDGASDAAVTKLAAKIRGGKLLEDATDANGDIKEKYLKMKATIEC